MLFLIVSLVLVLAGRQARRQAVTNTEIFFYYPVQAGGDLARNMESLVAGFNAANGKNINVIPVYTGSYGQTAQKALSDIASGKGPHVVLSGMLDIAGYYNAGVVTDLSPYIALEGPVWRNDFIDGFWDSFIFDDGGIYGLPFQHSVCVLFYNGDMLKAAGIAGPPSSQTEMLEALEALRAWNKNIIPLEFPSDVWILENLALGKGERLQAEGGKPRFNSSALVASLDFLVQLVKRGAMIQTWAAAAEDFVAESSAMMFNTSGNLAFLLKSATCNWDIAAMPSTAALSYGGGGLIMITGQKPAEEAASWEFIKYMTSAEVSARWMEMSGYFTLRKSTAAFASVQAYYAARPQAARIAAMLNNIQPQWEAAKYQDVYDIIQLALDKALIGKKTGAAEALDMAQAAAEAYFSNR